MRALITGINGFVGGHLAEYLLSLGGWQIWGLTRSAALRLPQLGERVQVLHADLCDAEQTLAAVAAAQPEVLFHLAGQPFVPESFRDPALTLHVNLFGTLNLIRALLELRLSPRMLVIGSNEEYGMVPLEQQPISEQTPLHPVNPYGVSKAAQGLLAMQYACSHTLEIIHMRPFTHIGPRQSARFVTAAWARQVARIEQGMQEPVLRVGNLDVQRDFSDVRDVVRAYVLVLAHGEPGTVYNVGSGQAVALRTILDFVISQSTVPIAVEVDPALLRPVDVPLVCCDAQRLRRHTGWQPQFSLEQTLIAILDDWRTRSTELR